MELVVLILLCIVTLAAVVGIIWTEFEEWEWRREKEEMQKRKSQQ